MHRKPNNVSTNDMLTSEVIQEAKIRFFILLGFDSFICILISCRNIFHSTKVKNLMYSVMKSGVVLKLKFLSLKLKKNNISEIV